MKREKTFAELVDEVRTEPPAPDLIDSEPRFRDSSGGPLTLVGEITPRQAQDLVREGARLAFEDCGCGGGPSCTPTWVEQEARERIAETSAPRPSGDTSWSWIELWENHAGSVVYLHGNVTWSDALP